ncbi:MAG TPA: cytochrome c biogenesis protein DipZ [Candidatus Babeliales bacterium]|nr:cytochrome c biogenesis protein DipZ [Candidatus Babeliales bacterium]
MIILILFSFLAGIVTVLSPCILPVLPLLLSAGVGEGKKRPLGIVCGLIVSFSFFTLTLTALVQLTGISPDFLRYIAIAIVTFFGLTLIFPSIDQWFERATAGVALIGQNLQSFSITTGSGFLSGFIIGIALGLIWTPCGGPILAAITTLVATGSLSLLAVVVTLAYSIGAAIPMFFIMYGSSKIINSTVALSVYAQPLRKIFGVLMIIGAFAIAFHLDDVVFRWVELNYFPTVSIENSETIKKELEKINPLSNPEFLPSQKKSQAPDFIGISQWINSAPRTLADLRGKVVLVDFWTYSCINCVRTFPYLKKWYSDYKDKGFVIIGVHTPEFEFEKKSANVKDAVTRFGITYPVALDNHYKTWQNYNNRFWPAHYLIDQNGIVVQTHFGEGNYVETENAIRRLLGLSPEEEKPEKTSGGAQTPETYLGYDRARAYSPEIKIIKNQTVDYSFTEKLGANHIGLKGQWFADGEFIRSERDGAQLDLNFIANRVYLVMDSTSEAFVEILLDGQPVPEKYRTVDMDTNGKLRVNQARMYDILDLKGDYGRHQLTLIFPKDVSAYAFTFGSGEK